MGLHPYHSENCLKVALNRAVKAARKVVIKVELELAVK